MKLTQPYPQAWIYARIVQAKLFIDQHFEEPINLDHISSQANFSKYHFIRLFRRAFGRTPHQYLIGVRMEKARKLLESGEPVSRVCYMLGFESISSFTGLFKRYAAITPSAYKEKQACLKREMKEQPLRFVPACFAIKNGWRQNSNFEEPV